MPLLPSTSLSKAHEEFPGHLQIFKLLNEFYYIYSCTTIIMTQFYSISIANSQPIPPTPQPVSFGNPKFFKVCESVSRTLWLSGNHVVGCLRPEPWALACSQSSCLVFLSPVPCLSAVSFLAFPISCSPPFILYNAQDFSLMHSISNLPTF